MRLTQQQLEAHLQELHPVVDVLQAALRPMGERGGRLWDASKSFDLPAKFTPIYSP
jgi:hypothetical protein